MVTPFSFVIVVALIALAIALFVAALKDGRGSTVYESVELPEALHGRTREGGPASGRDTNPDESTLRIRTRTVPPKPYRASKYIVIGVAALMLALMFGEWVWRHLEEDLQKSREAACCREEASVAPRSQLPNGGGAVVSSGLTEKVSQIEKTVTAIQKDVVALKVKDDLFTAEFAARGGSAAPAPRASNGLFGTAGECLTFHRNLFATQKGLLANTVPDDAAVERLAQVACAAIGPAITPRSAGG